MGRRFVSTTDPTLPQDTASAVNSGYSQPDDGPVEMFSLPLPERLARKHRPEDRAKAAAMYREWLPPEIPMNMGEKRQPWADFEAPPSLSDAGKATVARLLAECAYLSIEEKIDNQAQPSPDPSGWCPRARGRMVRDGDSVSTVWPKCRSRTCEHCRGQVDADDIGRVTWYFRDGPLYVGQMPYEKWRAHRVRVDRADEHTVKADSRRGHNELTVFASMPFPGCQPVHDEARAELIRDVITLRPPGSPVPRRDDKKHTPRPYLSGVRFPSRKEWELMNGTERPTIGESVELHPAVTPDAFEEAAAGLGLDTERPHPRQVRVLAEWEHPKVEMLLRWARDPSGMTWTALRIATEIAQGVRAPEQPPLDSYEEPAA